VKVDITLSELCPMAGFDVWSVEIKASDTEM
jgi:hypothetical protein